MNIVQELTPMAVKKWLVESSIVQSEAQANTFIMFILLAIYVYILLTKKKR